MSEFICNRLLLTNDDGIDAPGLNTLIAVASTLAREVWVVAPSQDQSCTSQSLSLHNPVRFRQVGEKQYRVNGTPADCVVLAVRHLMSDAPPDFILSGINRGANLGNETVFSGTVGAAMTGLLLGFHSVALSQFFTDGGNVRWDTARLASEKVLRQLLTTPWQTQICFNVNIPDTDPDKILNIMRTSQGTGNLQSIGITVREDPRGVPYAWLNLERTVKCERADSENTAVRAGNISVTPLHYDRTQYDFGSVFTSPDFS
ncbi:5'/3'-nucleotidase SurE [Pantoea ananatis]|uniref:5'/3'-nucleotidase SurE n=1 Tax=Pantoea ananas TaxID=553 RepID=UPI000CEB57FA|nr:5'/3'-nucleotidase SurE [Pantoea ananatis]AVG79013.1 5'/3'-nucleotidase SurE [Pantoea ananatis]PQL05307.1 5'/3'-nucleotidase SurE [Pantoea ananatis]PWK05821.1 5'-nucleotidase /3'-nucleotidase /exopolyphosphatase [Pantoea ananatis]